MRYMQINFEWTSRLKLLAMKFYQFIEDSQTFIRCAYEHNLFYIVLYGYRLIFIYDLFLITLCSYGLYKSLKNLLINIITFDSPGQFNCFFIFSTFYYV